MKIALYKEIKKKVSKAGYSWEICEVENILNNSDLNEKVFFRQYMWVIINAGMKYQVAVQIYSRVIYALYFNQPLELAFGNKNKVKAILEVQDNLSKYFTEYIKSADKVSYLETLPFIGPTTKYHLARNLGENICKPDRHLRRISSIYKTSPDKLCKKLSKMSGDPVGVVDVVVWRAANLGLI